MGCQLNRATNHCFMWDAAVPATALSSNERQMLLDKRDDRFLNASDAAEHITVLYNQHDTLVLGAAYYAAKYSGLTLHNIPERYLQTAAENWKQTLSDDRAQAAHQTLIDEHRCLGWLAQANPTPELQDKYNRVCKTLNRKLAEYHENPTIKALGLIGVEGELAAHDSLIQNMLQSGKLARADMSPYASGHSYTRRK